MAKYTIEYDEMSPTVAECLDRTVQYTYETPGYFATLRDDESADEYVYTWSNGLGSGELRIPAHVMYDLPTMMAILSEERRRTQGNGTCSPCRVYRSAPIASLFQEPDNA